MRSWMWRCLPGAGALDPVMVSSPHLHRLLSCVAWEMAKSPHPRCPSATALSIPRHPQAGAIENSRPHSTTSCSLASRTTPKNHSRERKLEHETGLLFLLIFLPPLWPSPPWLLVDIFSLALNYVVSPTCFPSALPSLLLPPSPLTCPSLPLFLSDPTPWVMYPGP